MGPWNGADMEMSSNSTDCLFTYHVKFIGLQLVNPPSATGSSHVTAALSGPGTCDSNPPPPRTMAWRHKTAWSLLSLWVRALQPCFIFCSHSYLSCSNAGHDIMSDLHWSGAFCKLCMCMVLKIFPPKYPGVFQSSTISQIQSNVYYCTVMILYFMLFFSPLQEKKYLMWTTMDAIEISTKPEVNSIQVPRSNGLT